MINSGWTGTSERWIIEVSSSRNSGILVSDSNREET